MAHATFVRKFSISLTSQESAIFDLNIVDHGHDNVVPPLTAIIIYFMLTMWESGLVHQVLIIPDDY
jgi:hypothetical protein